MLDDKFFAKVMKPDWQSSYELLAYLITETFHPKAVVEYGACAGWLLEYLRRNRIRVLMGYEPNDAARKYMPDTISEHVVAGDLTKPIKLLTDFDVSICLEVAEHIDAQFSDQIVKNVIQRVPLVLWSAATPGQGGYGHVNERPPEYWMEKFFRYGFIVDERATFAMRDQLRVGNAKKWYYKNLFVLRRG